MIFSATDEIKRRKSVLGKIFQARKQNLSYPTTSPIQKPGVFSFSFTNLITQTSLISAQMSSVKRKMPALNGGLQRRVRPRVEPEPESDIEASDSEAPSEEDIAASGSEDEDGSGSDDASDAGSDDDESVSSPPKKPHI